MNKKYKIKYSHEFDEDLNLITQYIKFKLNNVVAANNFVDLVENKLKERLKNPLGFQEYKTKEGNIYYRIYVKNYIIFYTINKDEMIVRRLFYKRRNISKLL